MEDGPDRGVRTKCRKQRTGRELLRAERITGQEQRSDRRNGTWFIRCLAESRDRGAICDARERISRCLTFDRAALPACWPLHQGPDVFWQELGKTIAAFGHLERNLASTCISLFVTPDRAKAFLESTSEEAASRWAKRMLRSKVDAMHRLIAELDKVLRGAGRVPHAVREDRITDLKELRPWHYALCRGAWLAVDEDGSGRLGHFFLDDGTPSPSIRGRSP